MLLSLVGLVGGLVLLTVASEHFVRGAARLAARLRVSAVVIGAVVIGFGTSTPELVVSGLAASRGFVDIGVGNVIGSNIANLTLVLGAAALLTPVVVARPVLRREAPLALLAVIAFGLAVQGGLTRVEGGLLVAALALLLAWFVRGGRDGDPELEREVDDFLDARHEHPLGRETVRTLLGLIGTAGGAQVLIVSAVDIAGRFGLAEGFVGLTVVAVGTSLPELATAIQAGRRGEPDLIVGNLLGSNIFNSLAVGGLLGLLAPGVAVGAVLTGRATIAMVAVAALATLFLATGRVMSRWEGAVVLVLYAAVLPFLA